MVVIAYSNTAVNNTNPWFVLLYKQAISTDYEAGGYDLFAVTEQKIDHCYVTTFWQMADEIDIVQLFSNLRN